MNLFRHLKSAWLGALLSCLLVGQALARPEFSAITVDARNGTVLFADHEDGLRHPASLTKMLTLYVLFQDLKAGRISRDTHLNVSARAASMAPSKLFLKAGSTITVDEAIRGLVTKSANDVAATIAENLGGTEADYAARMTRVAHSIGMAHSTFRNASGLPNPGQYTTARDMATLGLHLMRDFPQYYPYFRVTSFEFHGQTIRTHNKLVEKYAGTDGIKTGYIADSGFNLVTSTKRDDKRLVGVVLGARSAARRSQFMIAMFEHNFPKAHGGNTVAAIAGSADGVINPIAKVAEAAPSTLNNSPLDNFPLNSKALAQVAAHAAASDQVATAATSAGPKVVEATLGVSSHSPSNVPKDLPFAVVSAADKPETLQSTIATSWNIQVGAFPEKQQAALRIATLRGKLGAALNGKQAFSMEATKDGKLIYRARFAGFDEVSAEKTCSKAKKAGVACLAIAPQG